MKVTLNMSSLVYLPQCFTWFAVIFCGMASPEFTYEIPTLEAMKSSSEFINMETTNVLVDPETKSKEPKLMLQVFVNDKQISNGTVYYDVGDNIRFSCDMSNMPITAVYRYEIVHKIGETQQLIPPQGSILKFYYNIIADDLDNASSIYCTMEGDIINKRESDPKKLFMNTGNSKSGYNVIKYNEQPATFTCNSSGSKREVLKPTDSGSHYFCIINHESDETGKYPGKHYTREIYNKTEYKYSPLKMENNTTNTSGLSKTSISGISLGVAVCVVLVGVVCLQFVIKKRRAKLEPPPNRDNISNQVIYADLEFLEFEFITS